MDPAEALKPQALEPGPLRKCPRSHRGRRRCSSQRHKQLFSSFQVQDTTYRTDLGVSDEGGTNAQKHPELLCTYCSCHPRPTSTPVEKSALVPSVSASVGSLEKPTLRTRIPSTVGTGLYLSIRIPICQTPAKSHPSARPQPNPT